MNGTTAAGDVRPTPFERFYDAEYQSAVRLAHLMTGDAWAAEDLVQDVFARLHRRFPTLVNPSAFLRTSVVNACRSHHRRRTREARTLGGMVSTAAVTPQARELLDALDALPWRQKAVLVLRYYEDRSEAEIADILSCRPGTVKSLAARGLARLSKEVDR